MGGNSFKMFLRGEAMTDTKDQKSSNNVSLPKLSIYNGPPPLTQGPAYYG
jgi:hypothetical protein